MTESRLIDIKRNIMDDVSPLMDELILLAMKQAVNEALEEAAENAGIKLITTPCYYPGLGVEETTTEVVDKQSILKLKVK